MSVYVVAEQSGPDNYWIVDILSGIKKEADKKNLHIETFPLNMITGAENPVVLVVGYSRVWLESTCRRVCECGARPICVNAPAEELRADIAGSVSFDYFGAMRDLLSYLAQCTKRNIAFIGCSGTRLSFECKKKAFLQKAPEFYFEHANAFECRELQNITDSFMAQPIKYDAVICSRDAEAFALCSRLKKNGVRLPEDVFVASFGDSNMAKKLDPMLTSVKVDYAALGEEAVRLSRYLSQNRDGFVVNSVVRCPLSIRASTGDIAKQPDNFASIQKPLTYQNDNEYLSFLQAEQLVRKWDALDKKIVALLLEGRNTAAVAEKLFISHSSVKYRIKKMLTNAKIKDRKQLIFLVAKYDLL